MNAENLNCFFFTHYFTDRTILQVSSMVEFIASSLIVTFARDIYNIIAIIDIVVLLKQLFVRSYIIITK